MDHDAFDRLTQQFGRALTRRRFGAVAAALGLGAGLGAAPDATAKKKKKKKKKKPKPCPNGQARCGTACVETITNAQHCGVCGRACTGNQTCSGGQCVDAPECTNQAQCGGYTSYNDLVCRDGRCVCADEDEGLCRRLSDLGGVCDKCCPEGSGQCPFDEVCFYVQGPNGAYGYCDCPTGWQRCNYNPHPTGTCVQYPLTDSRKCGQFCEDCRTGVTGAICCNGSCMRGCGPGEVCFNQGQACGPNCLPCNSDSICCNMGPGTLPRCIPNLNNVCYPN